MQQAVQGQYGDATATADDESIAAAANTLGISQAQVNACLGSGGGNSPAPEPPASPEPSVAPTGMLPETGGASLLALGAGALLVAGGLVARRIVR